MDTENFPGIGERNLFKKNMHRRKITMTEKEMNFEVARK